MNIVAVPGRLGRSELAELGGARMSFGGDLAQLALAAAAEVEDFLGPLGPRRPPGGGH